MSSGDHHDDCYFDLSRHVFKSNLGAGDEVKCPDCGRRYLVSEHDNGSQSWYEFEPLDVEVS